MHRNRDFILRSLSFTQQNIFAGLEILTCYSYHRLNFPPLKLQKPNFAPLKPTTPNFDPPQIQILPSPTFSKSHYQTLTEYFNNRTQWRLKSRLCRRRKSHLNRLKGHRLHRRPRQTKVIIKLTLCFVRQCEKLNPKPFFFSFNRQCVIITNQLLEKPLHLSVNFVSVVFKDSYDGVEYFISLICSALYCRMMICYA